MVKSLLVFGLIIQSCAWASNITNSSEKYVRNIDSSNPNQIKIDVSKTGRTLPVDFYGSHLDAQSEIPAAQYFNELNVSKIRIGGNEYDVFNPESNLAITNSRGLIKLKGFDEIAQKLNSHNVKGIFQINLLGYQPELVGSDYVLKRTFDAQAATRLIKELNGAKKLGIKDFSLGNEFAQWHETHNHIWGSEDGISADEYIERFISYAIALRAGQEAVNGDPNSIKIWGPEISVSWLDWNTGNFANDCEWSDTPGQVNCHYDNGRFTHFIPYFLSKLKNAEKNAAINPKGYKLLDYFAFHYYPNFRTKISDINSIVTDSSGKQWVAGILEATRVLNDDTYINKIDLSSFKNSSPNILNRMSNWVKDNYPTAKLAINEFALDSDYRTTNYHPIIRPLYLADVVGIVSGFDISYFNHFVFNSPEGVDLPWVMLKGGKIKTDNFMMYKLLSNNFKGTVVEAKDSLGDIVNAYATLDGDMIDVLVVNKEPVAKRIEIEILNGRNSKGVSHVFPAWSVSVLKLHRNTGLFTKTYEYFQLGAKEMGIQVDTSYSK